MERVSKRHVLTKAQKPAHVFSANTPCGAVRDLTVAAVPMQVDEASHAAHLKSLQGGKQK